jgi:hypothetical protein
VFSSLLTNAAAVAAASLQATKTACAFANSVDFNEVELLLPEEVEVSLDRKISMDGVKTWTTPRGITFFLAPVFVCKHPKRTVGECFFAFVCAT